MQPKFKDCVFESDKDPKYFRVWVRLLSGIVRNIPGGAAIENFLDNYLSREKYLAMTRPAFLDDPLLTFGASGGESSTTESNLGTEAGALPEIPPTENVQTPDQDPRQYSAPPAN